MFRIVASILAGGIAGFALALVGPDASTVDRSGQTVPFVESEPSCEADIDLEAALLLERSATRRLLQEIDRLESDIERLSAIPSATEGIGTEAWFEQAWSELVPEEPRIDRRQQLLDGGFDPARADWIARREAELRRAVVDARRGPLPMDQLEIGLRARQALRSEIGDYEYERYLAATGQSTIVTITQVMPDSAAAQGGLQVGDAIVDYDGARVFNVFELSNATSGGTPGGTAIVTIERDGSPMQLVLPRGKLGISAGSPRRP